MMDATVKQALERPDSFGYWGELPLFDTWSIGQFAVHRDSTLLDQSNWDAILKILEKQNFGAEDFQIVQTSHWAVGWVDHLAYRVLDDNGNVTPIHSLMVQLHDEIENYPILDEDDFYTRERGAILDCIIGHAAEYIMDDVPEDWASLVYFQLSDEGEDFTDQYVDEGAVKEALKALGFFDYSTEEED